MLNVTKILFGIINIALSILFLFSLRTQKEDLIESTKLVSFWCLVNGWLLILG